jgi:hypothetical protein
MDGINGNAVPKARSATPLPMKGMMLARKPERKEDEGRYGATMINRQSEQQIKAAKRFFAVNENAWVFPTTV